MDRNLTALAVMIAGTILFFYTMSLWLYGSIIILISSIGVALAIGVSGEREERIKQLEDRIRKLEAEKEKENYPSFFLR